MTYSRLQYKKVRYLIKYCIFRNLFLWSLIFMYVYIKFIFFYCLSITSWNSGWSTSQVRNQDLSHYYYDESKTEITKILLQIKIINYKIHGPFWWLKKAIRTRTINGLFWWIILSGKWNRNFFKGLSLIIIIILFHFIYKIYFWAR